MAQITHGLRSILSNPYIYNLSQNIAGARRVRTELIKEFIRPKHKASILDIGCGTAEILALLPSHINYYGYDISPIYIESARKNFGSRGNFVCGLFDKNEAIKHTQFDIVLILGALHHMDDVQVSELLLLANNVLSESGRLITMDPCYVDGQNPVARFIISNDRGQNVRNAEAYAMLARSVFQQVKSTLRHRSWIPYTHWIMECSK